MAPETRQPPGPGDRSHRARHAKERLKLLDTLSPGMALPKSLRRMFPDRVRDDPRIRPLALRLGLIPPRTMHTELESELLAELAEGRHRAVEIGVYEGGSAKVLVEALPSGAELHLVEPFGEGPAPGYWTPADERATRFVVERATRSKNNIRLTWHVATSVATAHSWRVPLDLLFIDGDHEENAVRLDWELWSPWVEPGGVVAFHDARAGQPRGWGEAGPTAVVNELFREGTAPGWRIVAERDSVVAAQRR